MNRLLLLALIPAAMASGAVAQSADPHAHHKAAPPPAEVDPHAGHAMPAPAAKPAGGPAATGADLQVGDAAPPTPPTDSLADGIHGAAAMDAARAQLRLEHGGAVLSKTMIDTFELRPDGDGDTYAWEAEGRYGGDINRLVLKTDGEGEVDGHLESAELQVLYSRAVGPYFDLQAGVRHDFEPGPSRTHLTVGVEGLAPYWFEVEGAAFLSHKGDLTARFEGAYDLRLTQRLILEPRAEIGLSAQDIPALGVGSGFTEAEFGLRLRYEIRREFAPYVGVIHERSLGETADLARAAGESARDTRVVLGVRAWF